MKTDDEDNGGLIDNFLGRQQRAPAEAVFPDGRRTTDNDDENAEPVIYLTRYGIPQQGDGRPPSFTGKGDKRVLEDIRYDGIKHYFVETPENKDVLDVDVKGDHPVSIINVT